MTPEQRYLFDLKGYLVVRAALDAATVGQINEIIDGLEKLTDEQSAERGISRQYRGGDGLYATVAPPPPGRLADYDTPALPCGEPYERLIDWPATIGLVQELIGEPMRLDAASFMSRNPGGGFRFHHGYAELLPYCEYVFADGQFKCVSIKIGYALTDVNVDDGAFVVIPGSHKSNFTNPLVGQVPDLSHPLVEAIPCRAGDAILFTEDLSHAAVENRGAKTRRTLFYSYAPAYQCRWPNLCDPADNFENHATPGQIELVTRPATFAPA